MTKTLRDKIERQHKVAMKCPNEIYRECADQFYWQIIDLDDNRDYETIKFLKALKGNMFDKFYEAFSSNLCEYVDMLLSDPTYYIEYTK